MATGAHDQSSVEFEKRLEEERSRYRSMRLALTEIDDPEVDLTAQVPSNLASRRRRCPTCGSAITTNPDTHIPISAWHLEQ